MASHASLRPTDASHIARLLRDIQVEALDQRVQTLIEQMHLMLLELDLQNRQLVAAQHHHEQLQERFDLLFEEAPVGYLLLDVGGRIQQINQRACEYLGIERRRLLDKGFTRFLHETSRATFRHHLLRAHQTGSAQSTLTLVTTSGRYKHFLIDSSRTLSTDQDLTGFRCVLVDVDPLIYQIETHQAAADQAAASNHFQREMLASLSHELRMPLSSIMGFATLLEEELSEEHHIGFAKVVHRNGQRLLDTLNSVLDYARLQASDEQVDLLEVEVVKAVHEQVVAHQSMAGQKGLVLTAEHDVPSVTAHLDAGLLGRVLSNLLDNAIKYTQTGSVTVRTYTTEHQVHVAVTDTGQGIAPEQLEALFAPFTSGAAHTGPGLGLSIVHHMVDLMNGTITVESEVGTGSQFKLSFDLVHVDDRSGALHSTVTSEGAWSADEPLRILVVDDDADMLELVEWMMPDATELHKARSPGEARRLLQAHDFDAAFIDHALSHSLTGTDILEWLRSSEAGLATYAVAFTAYRHPFNRDDFIERGFDDYLVKPFDLKQLHRVLRRAQVAASISP
ncbi:MAG: ATP-binding protein [Bacteroidota bacterium]